MILPRKCTHTLGPIYFVVSHDKIAIFLRRSNCSIMHNQKKKKRELLESSFPFSYVFMYMGFKAVASYLKYMKAPRKIYLFKVKVSKKTKEICIDYFHFTKKNDVDFKTQSHVFIVLCWHDEYMLKMYMCTIIYHVGMCMFYVILHVETGKSLFCCVCLSWRGGIGKFNRSWGTMQANALYESCSRTKEIKQFRMYVDICSLMQLLSKKHHYFSGWQSIL